MTKQIIILDCDTRNEIDDQFAITYSLKSPSLQVEGVVSVQNQGMHGADSVDIYHEEAQKVLAFIGSTVPAFKGSRSPLQSVDAPATSEGVAFLIDRAKALGSKLTVVGTGPATNIANACLLAPEIMKTVKVIWIGGYRDNSEMRRVNGNECNSINDLLSVEVIANSGLDLLLLPAHGVTDRMMAQTVVFQEELCERDTPITHYLADLLKEVDRRYWIFWDLAAVSCAIPLGVERIIERAAPVVNNGMIEYPTRSVYTVQVVDRIDEFAMLADAKRRILS